MARSCRANRPSYIAGTNVAEFQLVLWAGNQRHRRQQNMSMAVADIPSGMVLIPASTARALLALLVSIDAQPREQAKEDLLSALVPPV